MWVIAIEPGLLERQSMLLTSESSIQSPFKLLCFISIEELDGEICSYIKTESNRKR